MKPTEEKIHSSPSDLPVYLFKQGNNWKRTATLARTLCSRTGGRRGVPRLGTACRRPSALWAISTAGHPGASDAQGGRTAIWELFIPGIKQYDVYKYCVTTPADELVYKADPYAFHTETRPSNGSKVYDLTAMPGMTPGSRMSKKAGCDQRPHEHLRDARRQLEDEGPRTACPTTTPSWPTS